MGGTLFKPLCNPVLSLSSALGVTSAGLLVSLFNPICVVSFRLRLVQSSFEWKPRFFRKIVIHYIYITWGLSTTYSLKIPKIWGFSRKVFPLTQSTAWRLPLRSSEVRLHSLLPRAPVPSFTAWHNFWKMGCTPNACSVVPYFTLLLWGKFIFYMCKLCKPWNFHGVPDFNTNPNRTQACLDGLRRIALIYHAPKASSEGRSHPGTALH